MKRCLICANPDLNLIDGSSIWAQTITLALAETGYLQIDFLAKSRPVREELFSPLESHAHINVIDGCAKRFCSEREVRCLDPRQMVEVVKQLDAENCYDIIVVRGYEIAQAVAKSSSLIARSWIYLTDIPQQLELASKTDVSILTQIANGARRILCQSEGFFEIWKNVAPSSSGKLVSYAPLIPDINGEIKPIRERSKKAIYAGKFCADWKTLEMAESWPEVVTHERQAKLIMIGDLIRDEKKVPNYKLRMINKLENTEGLRWLGALSRQHVQRELLDARVGLSWRSDVMDETAEFSTKIIEYGGAGCAAILNRNPLHEKLIGEDYPLFANSYSEYIEKIVLALRNDEVCQFAADRLHDLASKHTFTSRVSELSEWIKEDAMKKTILVAGHDLKFFGLLQQKLEETGRYKFLFDKWQGHNKHDEKQSLNLLKKADIIFCEWCLGNLKWYSENKLPDQRLVARFHLQEKNLPYLSEANISAVNYISYVSEQIKYEANAVVKIDESKTSVIANLMDDKKFTARKKTAEAQYTLGIIGVSPKRKRIDLALDTLELLLEKDQRFQLRIKGKHPFDYPWLINRQEELDYYMDIMGRINSSDVLRYKVIFDPSGDDVDQWLTMVGFILSPSDFESFHMAIGEGMLTGSVPVVWNWPGASEIWPEESIVNSPSEAAERVLSIGGKDWADQSKQMREYVTRRYGVTKIRDEWQEIIND